MNSIAHLAITCRDMEASLKFYTEALGCVKAFQISHPKDGSPWIEYLSLGGGQFIELFYGGEKDCPWRPENSGFNHLCIAVDDIHAATQKVIDAGYTMDSMPKQGSDKNWQSWTKDPDGCRVELMQIDPESPQARFM